MIRLLNIWPSVKPLVKAIVKPLVKKASQAASFFTVSTSDTSFLQTLIERTLISDC